MPTLYTTTFGRYINHVYLPLYVDVENDDIQVHLTNDKNYYLNLYASEFGVADMKD